MEYPAELSAQFPLIVNPLLQRAARRRTGPLHPGYIDGAKVPLVLRSLRSLVEEADDVANLVGCGCLPSLQDLILKHHAFQVVFLQPRLNGILVRKDLEVILVTDLLARMDIDPNCHVSVRRNDKHHYHQNDAYSRTQD
jgi:hypothetical protein